MPATLYSLGIISNAGDNDDESSIALIRNLVEDSIKGNTLILLTITMRGQPADFVSRCSF